MSNKINVILVDDHEMVRLGLKSFLNLQGDVEVVGEAGNGLRAGNFHSSLCGCENVPHVRGKTGRLQCEDGDNIRK